MATNLFLAKPLIFEKLFKAKIDSLLSKSLVLQQKFIDLHYFIMHVISLDTTIRKKRGFIDPVKKVPHVSTLVNAPNVQWGMVYFHCKVIKFNDFASSHFVQLRKLHYFPTL